MPRFLYDRKVTDQEYRARIRRHSPSTLLPLVAAAAAQFGGPGDAWFNSPYRKYTPWALADIARVSLSHGVEFGRSAARDDDLLGILAAYDALDDPFRREPNASDALRGFLLRKAGEQFGWQTPEYGTLARSVAIFLQTQTDRSLKHLGAGWDTELFGCPLADYVGTAQLLWASALACNGRFDPALFQSPDGERFAQHIDERTVLSVLEAHFAINKETFRAKDEAVRQRNAKQNTQLRRYTFNTLRERPPVDGFGSGYLFPGPKLILSKVSPLGIYFSGLDMYGTAFTIEVGYLFEQYIGRQLSLLDEAEVIPEIHYKERKDNFVGVDWIVVFDDLVLLVEVKSAIPTEAIQLGTANAAQHVFNKLEKAYRQIDRTTRLIKDRRPEFRIVPDDRPMLGIAVTLEPFHLTDSPFLRDSLPTTQVPVSVVSAAEIEELVSITDAPVSTLLLERQADAERSTWSLSAVLHGHVGAGNPILEAAWNTYPWSSAVRPQRDPSPMAQAGDSDHDRPGS